MCLYRTQVDFIWWSTNPSNQFMRSFVWREFLSSMREDDARRWRLEKSPSLGMPPWHPPRHSRRLKRLSLGMPKASPLLHRQSSGHLRWNYVFITLHIMCYSWSINLFLFVCWSVTCLILINYIVWERDTLCFFVEYFCASLILCWVF